MLKHILYLCAVTGSCVLAVLNEQYLELNEIDTYRVMPEKKVGSFTSKDPAKDVCSNCTMKAREVIDRNTQYKYFSFFKKNDNISNPFELAGIKACREIDDAFNCYQKCFEKLTDTAPVVGLLEYKYLRALKQKYCETPTSPQHPSCRLADIQGCEMDYKKRLCGQDFEKWKKCVSETLYLSGQDCSGLCTKARRFHKAMMFMATQYCYLRESPEARCETVFSTFCFRQVKDGEFSYGIYEDLEKNATLANNLDLTCQILQSPYPCIWNITYGFYDYGTRNITYGCQAVEGKVIELNNTWNDMIRPFCDRGANVKTIDEACPPPGVTETPLVIDRSNQTARGQAVTTQSSWQFATSKPGSCPEEDPSKCNGKCGDNSHCDGNMLCCNGCCRDPILKRGKPGSGGAQGSNDAPGVFPSLALTLSAVVLMLA